MFCFEVDYFSSSQIGLRLVLSVISQRPPFEGQKERRTVRSYLHSEKENRYNIRRNVHHTEPSKCIL